MYESIRGKVRRREPTAVVVDCAGLAYRIQIPLGTYEALPSVDQEVCLLLHLVVREDEWRLFGFGREDERAVFRRLIRIAGIGPALALSLLSGLRPAELRTAVAQGDLKALARVKGVGRKTAERIVVELREEWRLDEVGGETVTTPVGAGPGADAVRALESLGMEPEDARRRVHALLTASKHLAAGELVRLALRS